MAEQTPPNNTPRPKKPKPGFTDNRPHWFDSVTMGKDKRAARLEYWRRKLQAKPTDGSTVTPMTWKQISEHKDFKKGEFNKFRKLAPKNVTQARDRYEARRYWSAKFAGSKHDDKKPMSWKDIKAHKDYKAGGYKSILRKRRRLMGMAPNQKEKPAPKPTTPPATPPADQQQS